MPHFPSYIVLQTKYNPVTPGTYKYYIKQRRTHMFTTKLFWMGCLFGVFSLVIIGGTLKAAVGHHVIKKHFHSDLSQAQLDKRKDRIVKKVGNKLKFTADQRSQFAVIVEEIQSKRQILKGSHIELAGILETQMNSDNFESDKLASAIKNKIEIVEGEVDFMAQKIAEFHALLTDDQRAKLNSKLNKVFKKIKS